MSGANSYHAGFVAEDQVAREYERRGNTILQRRWRKKGGEVDLIAQNDHHVVFVEVKRAANFARAAERVHPRQMKRLYAAAAEFLGEMPKGLDTDARFDVALVNGLGEIEILENAFGH
ncbi:MAG: YraN family protein [Marinosulfonomonas sp.]